MSNSLNSYADESGQDPAEIKRWIEDTYSEIIPIINEVKTAGDAVNLFHRWEQEFNTNGESTILNGLVIFDDLGLIDRKIYESTLLLLDYASSHGVIELDCSELVEDSKSSTTEESILFESKDELVDALINKKYDDDDCMSNDFQFRLRLELLRLSVDDLKEKCIEEGFSDLNKLHQMYGPDGIHTQPDPQDLEYISSLQDRSNNELMEVVNCGELKTFHDLLYDFYISNDSGSTYREYFDFKEIPSVIDSSLYKELFNHLVSSEFPQSTAQDLEELIEAEFDAKENCIDFIWDKDAKSKNGENLSIDFMIFALKKISKDHTKLSKRLSKNLLKSINQV